MMDVSSRQFQIAILNAHNVYRAQHNAQSLTLNRGLCQYAQEWANTLACRKTLQHRKNDKYGENLYACFGKTNVTADAIVSSWYNEIAHYRFSQPCPGDDFTKVGHFTQLVWKDTSELGVGRATTEDNVFVVCNYNPYGNVMGQYHLNVTRH